MTQRTNCSPHQPGIPRAVTTTIPYEAYGTLAKMAKREKLSVAEYVRRHVLKLIAAEVMHEQR